MRVPGIPFPVWPEAASDWARGVDNLYIFLLLVTGAVIFSIFLAIAIFAVKYRRRSETERPRPIYGSIPLEVTWVVVPLAIFMVIFVWGATLFFKYTTPPPDAMRIYVVGKQWMWYIQHPSGRQAINELHVPVNQPIELVLASQDVIHSFFIPALRAKVDAVPGRYRSLWFKADRTGSFHFFCAEFCGTGHSTMIGTIHVLEPAQFERWLAGNEEGETMAAAGEKLAQRLGCLNCHGIIAPPWQGVYMSRVALRDGSVVVANEQYLRESILEPGAKIVAGFDNIMPSFKGLVDEVELLQLLEYIKSLGNPAMVDSAAGKEQPQSAAPAPAAGTGRR